jgi:ribonuclease BN (tRNA processing enzyme)
VRLTVIGSAGSYPGPASSASCYLLEQEHEGRLWRVLLDMGSGALGSLQHYSDASTIDGVFLSHLHADHCLDLCGYYVMRKYHPGGALPRIPVWGPEDTARRMAKAYDLEEDPGMNEEFEFLAYADEPVVFGPFTVTARRVAHPVTAYALRIEAGGRTLAYSGDTGVCEGLDTTARDSDLFLCEASFVDGDENPPDLHLTGTEAGDTAARAGTRRLLLTHVPPWHDPQVMVAEARSVYDGALDLATPGTSYDV